MFANKDNINTIQWATAACTVSKRDLNNTIDCELIKLSGSEFQQSIRRPPTISTFPKSTRQECFHKKLIMQRVNSDLAKQGGRDIFWKLPGPEKTGALTSDFWLSTLLNYSSIQNATTYFALQWTADDRYNKS